MRVNVCEIVPCRRIFWIEFACFLPLFYSAVLVMDVVEKTAIGEARLGVVRMFLQKTFVGFCYRLEPLFDAQA